jgi:hypothetical protein
MKKWMFVILALAGAVCAQVEDQGWRFVVHPEAVNLLAAGAVQIDYDLSEVPLETSLNSVIWYKLRASGEGSNPAFAVWAVDAAGVKLEYVTEVTVAADTQRSVPFPVYDYMRRHLKDGSVSFRIEPRGAPGFSQSVEFVETPMLAIVKAQTPNYDLQELLAPVWKGNHMANETILPTSYAGQPAEANLAFVPSKIISVKNYALDKTYEEGEDYTVDGRTIRLTDRSSIPFFNYTDLYHNNPNAKPQTMKTVDGGFLTFSESALFNDKQLAVTYEHDEPWNGPVPKPAKKQLPKSFQALETGRPFKLVVFGDSISGGGSASGRTVRAPWMPRWSDLVAAELGRRYGSDIDYINSSLGGMVSAWGRKTVDGLVAYEKPDLIILGFGMNDAGFSVPSESFAANTQAIMDSIREQNPDAEFILLMSFQNNSKWRSLEPMIDYLEVLKAMEGPGVTVVDMWTMHGYLLKNKTYWDMTGNHVNHPNDFLVRVYAQTLLAALGVE